ncbi:uncharacterized protein LOC130677376 [Microplitis mediator]|uniref:uncharacterized protein LOC130677376 n=1 Tax=Microplitis mediator TaxID=375433 RepID=UPI002555A0B0|nr:uncharacterized protein LOC130677376 [Microplitis mediator]
MQSFLVVISFVILLTDEVHSWRISGNNTTKTPTSTTPICDCNPDSIIDPRAPNYDPLMTRVGFLPKVWQIETIMTVKEIEALTNNIDEKLSEYLSDTSHYRLQPFGKNVSSLDLRNLPKVVLLKPTLLDDNSKVAKTFTTNDSTVEIKSFLERSPPSIDNVWMTFNSHSSEPMVYIKVDTNWPIAKDFHNGRMRMIFNAVPVYF